MPSVTIHSQRATLTFGDNPLIIDQLIHSSGLVAASRAEQVLLIRLPNRLSDPVFLSRAEVVQLQDPFTFKLSDLTGQFSARVEIEGGDSGIQFSVSVTAPEPIWMVEWRVYGLHLEEIIIPALGGQALNRLMPEETDIVYKYPFWWNAQFALATLNTNDGFWIDTREDTPRLKNLIVRKLQEAADLFALGLGFEVESKQNTLEAQWYLDGYTGGWEVPVEQHRTWMEETFNLSPFDRHPNYPAWMNNIRCILEIWGMRKDLGRPSHTFAQMIERVEAFSNLFPPENTLLYLPGFAVRGIDSDIPNYEPAVPLGGKEGLRRLIDRSHELGYRVMLHTNILGMAFTHPLFPQFMRYQVIDPFDRPQGWGMDIDGDWLAEPYFAYINPGHAEWGDLMESILGSLIRHLEPDSIFLDQTLLAFNDRNGPNFIEGMVHHIRRLQHAFPEILFAGEGIHEHVLPVQPVVQIHGLDSIADIHGREGLTGWRYVHPVSTFLFSPYTRFMAHLLTRHPSHRQFKIQEAAYKKLDVIPALVLYRDSHELDGPAVREMLDRASRLIPKSFSKANKDQS